MLMSQFYIAFAAEKKGTLEKRGVAQGGFAYAQQAAPVFAGKYLGTLDMINYNIYSLPKKTRI